jgi:hypothetical protein
MVMSELSEEMLHALLIISDIEHLITLHFWPAGAQNSPGGESIKGRLLYQSFFSFISKLGYLIALPSTKYSMHSSHRPTEPVLPIMQKFV